MDFRGWRYFEERNHVLVTGMAAYEHPVSTNSGLGPVLPIPGQNARMNELDQRAPVILRQSTRLGIYRPPAF